MENNPSYLLRLSAKTGDILQGRCDAQAAAICWRGAGAQTEVLLITSRDTGRWVIPKGNVERKEGARRAAVRETREEAGISGKVSKKPFGCYTYLKCKENTACLVDVFLLEVTKSRDRFPKADKRQFEWVAPLEASRRVEEPELKSLFQRFAADTLKSPKAVRSAQASPG